MKVQSINFLRYPGGKQRLLRYLMQYLPSRLSIKGRFVEPFVGGGAVFFALHPRQAILADINEELIELYQGISDYPDDVWNVFQAFPATKDAYYEIRNGSTDALDLASRAARTLYLSRTCFKGMWRHNTYGQFNVGYGGQDRRWVISRETLLEISKRLKCAELRVSDFESVINGCSVGDFLFIDPPYRPGEREIIRGEHYAHCEFSFGEHKRLRNILERATQRGVQWAMTTTCHPDIQSLFHGNKLIPIPMGTGKKPGILTNNSGEVLICNYEELTK
jgi:DNA adenine methylase